MDSRVGGRDPGRPWHGPNQFHAGFRLRIDEAEIGHDLALGKDDRRLDREYRAPHVTEQAAEVLERGVEVVDHDADVELVGPVHQGSSTTRIAPLRRSAATRKAS